MSKSNCMFLYSLIFISPFKKIKTSDSNMPDVQAKSIIDNPSTSKSQEGLISQHQSTGSLPNLNAKLSLDMQSDTDQIRHTTVEDSQCQKVTSDINMQDPELSQESVVTVDQVESTDQKLMNHTKNNEGTELPVSVLKSQESLPIDAININKHTQMDNNCINNRKRPLYKSYNYNKKRSCVRQPIYYNNNRVRSEINDQNFNFQNTMQVPFEVLNATLPETCHIQCKTPVYNCYVPPPPINHTTSSIQISNYVDQKNTCQQYYLNSFNCQPPQNYESSSNNKMLNIGNYLENSRKPWIHMYPPHDNNRLLLSCVERLSDVILDNIKRKLIKYLLASLLYHHRPTYSWVNSEIDNHIYEEQLNRLLKDVLNNFIISEINFIESVRMEDLRIELKNMYMKVEDAINK